MWFEIDFSTFALNAEGLYRSVGAGTEIYSSEATATLASIDDLMEREYCHAVEVDTQNQRVSFGRDYLGHYPLLFTQCGQELLVSDDMSHAVDWLRQRGVEPQISEESLALYFAMGYIPQGRTCYKEITACRNAGIYHWNGQAVVFDNRFTEIAVDSSLSLDALADAIEGGVDDIAAAYDDVDVWCSGGLDSCIMAQLFNDKGRKNRLLTMDYSDEVAAVYGRGEVPFAELMQQHLQTDLKKVVLDDASYRHAYEQFTRGHIGPVLDPVVVPKYVLAGASNKVAITGEGGDPLFSGVKNNKFLFIMENAPNVSLGEIYARVHNRFFDDMTQFLTAGESLKEFVIETMNEMMARYPGDLVRKLFYLNTFEKQGGMIFPKNYYAGKYNQVKVLHPLTSLAVYKVAFALSDDLKYQYPKGKLSLIELYAKQLPESVIKRKKSGTRLPMQYYRKPVSLDASMQEWVSTLPFFHSAVLERYQQSDSYQSALQEYAVATLANFFYHQNQPRGKHHDTNVSIKSSSL